ncbi:MAG: hypothetical protein ACE5HX_11655, partial [bacterium]
AYINHPNTDDLILDTDYYFRPRKGAVPRKVFFDLTQPVSGSGAIERGTQTLVAFLNVDKLYDVSLATGFAQFNFGGYILRFGVEDGTDPVQVTGTPAEGPWSVTTTGDGIAKLLKFKRGRLVDLGNYYMPFSITIGLKK